MERGLPGPPFRQPELASTMRRMAEVEKQARGSGKSREQAIDAVRDFFYRGEIAHKIADFIKQHNGILKYDDADAATTDSRACSRGRDDAESGE